MYPDVGAIIGISLAAAVLVLAAIALCMLNIPCCRNITKAIVGENHRNRPRPSRTSRLQFINFPFQSSSTTSTRNLEELSAPDLNSRNQQCSSSTTGVANPMWQLQCHSCGMFLTASQLNLNHHHQCGTNQSARQCCHYQYGEPVLGQSSGHLCTSATNFQYGAPQLHSPSESPPPYPGPRINQQNSNEMMTARNSSVVNSSSVSLPSENPPPYNPYPKY